MGRLDLIVGPNGAGKTTLSERAIATVRPGLPFVNADRIASDRFPGEAVTSRYEWLWPNIIVAAPSGHRVVFYDNSADDGPSEVAAYRYGVSD